MDGCSRFAVYFAPPEDSALGRFGADWLGWDAATGRARAGPELPGLPRPRAELTEVPRRYGFHATLKAPFRLADGRDAAGLDAALAALAAGRAAFELPRLALTALGAFLALAPAAASAPLAGIAAACVTELDGFRAPLTEADIARRAAGLDGVEAAHLRRWGYPYVLDRFRFHLTLTGPLAPADRAAAESALAPVLARCSRRCSPSSISASSARRKTGASVCSGGTPCRRPARRGADPPHRPVGNPRSASAAPSASGPVKRIASIPSPDAAATFFGLSSMKTQASGARRLRSRQMWKIAGSGLTTPS